MAVGEGLRSRRAESRHVHMDGASLGQREVALAEKFKCRGIVAEHRDKQVVLQGSSQVNQARSLF